MAVLSFLLSPLSSPSWAQANGEAEVESEAGVVRVTGASVAEMAAFIVSVLQESGAVPDWLQAKTVGGKVRRLSAADAFAALARTMRQWDIDAALPESVPVVIGAVSPPVLAVSDLPDQLGEGSREIPTDLFVSQSTETVRCLGQFRMVPSAIWVGAERISSPDYMAGMAIAIDYAYRTAKVEPTIALARFLPPPAWIAHTELNAEYVEEEPGEGDADGQGEEVAGLSVGTPAVGAKAGRSPVPPVQSGAPAPPADPKLALLPASGAKVSGTVDLVANYLGPQPRFVVFLVDQEVKAISNTPPYSYRWDTSRLTPGPHRLKVRALGEGDLEIIAVENTYTVAEVGAKGQGPGASNGRGSVERRE